MYEYETTAAHAVQANANTALMPQEQDLVTLRETFRMYNIAGVNAVLNGNEMLASEYYKVADTYGDELSRRYNARVGEPARQSLVGKFISKVLGIKAA